MWAACARAGFRQTNVNWHLTPDEAAYIVRDCGAKAFIADVGAADALPRAEAPIRLSIGGDLPGFDRYDDVLAGEDGHRIDDPTLGTAMLYTSGTTGYPKGVAKAPDPDATVAGLLPYVVRRRRRAPLHRSAVPRRARGRSRWSIPLALRRARRADGALGPGGGAAARSRRTASRTPTWCRPCSTGCCRCRRTCARSTTSRRSRRVVHGAAPCPVDVKQRIIEWFGPVLFEYYSATEGYGTVVDSATLAAQAGHRRAAADPEHLYVGDDDGARLPPATRGSCGSTPPGRPASSTSATRQDGGRLPGRALHPRRRRPRRRRRLPVPDRPHVPTSSSPAA